MATKIKTITFSHGWRYEGLDKTDPFGVSNGYRIEKITDSVEFRPNQILHKDTVDELCRSKDWKITIVGIK